MVVVGMYRSLERGFPVHDGNISRQGTGTIYISEIEKCFYSLPDTLSSPEKKKRRKEKGEENEAKSYKYSEHETVFNYISCSGTLRAGRREAQTDATSAPAALRNHFSQVKRDAKMKKSEKIA
jgi:hypothetical protein